MLSLESSEFSEADFQLGGGQPYLNLFKPIPILEAEGVIGLNRF